MKALTQTQAIDRFKAQVKEAFTPKPKVEVLIMCRHSNRSMREHFTSYRQATEFIELMNDNYYFQARIVKPRKQ